MTLLQALRETCRRLDRSQDSCWSPVAVRDARATLLRAIEALEAGASCDTEELHFLFLPTGPIQEISIDNGWGEEMLRLAEVVDRSLGAVGPARPWWMFWKR